jgi:hypothetical protein
MLQSNFELRLSFLVVIFLAVIYVAYEAIAIPAGGHPFGHALGILGTVLMIMTETLYSMRKRSRLINFGRMRHWLSFHIFTGIVGPALVLMHTGLAFRGLAGLTMLLTILVVASGFLGRYIYTAVPRTLAGTEVDRRALEDDIARQRAELQAWSQNKSQRIQDLINQETNAIADQSAATIGAILTRRWQEWREDRRIKAALRRLEQEEQARLHEMETMLRRQRRLARQIRSLATVRRMMGLWHTFHVPLGLTLFTAVAIHVLATIYYGALS